MSSICKVPSPFYHGEEHTLLVTHSRLEPHWDNRLYCGSWQRGRRQAARRLAAIGECVCVDMRDNSATCPELPSFHWEQSVKERQGSDTHMHRKHTHKHSIAITLSHMLTPASVQLSLPINY